VALRDAGPDVTGATVLIDLWLWPLDCGTAEAERRATLLTEAEGARADRLNKERDRIRFIAGRSRLREILSDYAGTAAASLPLQEGQNGKPVLPGGPVFNLSHASGLAALAITADTSVWLGVDIEGARAVDPGLGAHVFAPEERTALHSVDTSAHDWAFFLGWTRKEAVVKATGEGLCADLQSFAVTLDPALPPRLLRIDGDGPGPGAWRLYDFRPRDDLAGTIAAMTGGREILVNCRT